MTLHSQRAKEYQEVLEALRNPLEQLFGEVSPVALEKLIERTSHLGIHGTDFRLVDKMRDEGIRSNGPIGRTYFICDRQVSDRGMVSWDGQEIGDLLYRETGELPELRDLSIRGFLDRLTPSVNAAHNFGVGKGGGFNAAILVIDRNKAVPPERVGNGEPAEFRGVGNFPSNRPGFANVYLDEGATCIERGQVIPGEAIVGAFHPLNDLEVQTRAAQLLVPYFREAAYIVLEGSE